MFQIIRKNKKSDLDSKKKKFNSKSNKKRCDSLQMTTRTRQQQNGQKVKKNKENASE